MSLIRETDAQVEDNLKRVDRLRQGMLRKAFTGSLVVNARGAIADSMRVKESI